MDKTYRGRAGWKEFNANEKSLGSKKREPVMVLALSFWAWNHDNNTEHYRLLANMKFLKKYLKWIIATPLILLALLQLTNPAHINPPVTHDFMAATQPPPEVAAMLRSACYDCHSDETRWPWYSHLAPMSWQIARDVYEGRKHVNLSEWPADLKLAQKKIGDMSDEVDDGDMPLPKYTLIHKDARLTERQRNELTQWLDAQVDDLKLQAAQAGK
jgi:hypothetical protein